MSRKKNSNSGIQGIDRTKIILEVIGLIGTLAVAYLGYRQVIDPLRAATIATQTAVSIVNTPTLNPTEIATPTIQPTASPTSTVTSAVSAPLPAPAVGDHPEFYIIHASCNCTMSISTSKPLLLRLRWGAKTRELAETGANLVNYAVSVNGVEIQGIEQFRKPAIFAENPAREGDPPNAWWVYWDYPIPPSSLVPLDTDVIETTLRTLSAIDTGWDILPAGTTDTFVVRLVSFHPAPFP